MDLEADFWHGKVKTYLVSYKLFKFYAKPKKSDDFAIWSQNSKTANFQKWAKSADFLGLA